MHSLHTCTCAGTLNTMWNILSNGTLSLRWERPTWDERNIIRQVKINCSVSDNVILEDRSISDDNMIILDLDGLNLNAIIICCHTIITLMNETGPQKCEALEYHQRSTIGGKLSYLSLTCWCRYYHNSYNSPTSTVKLVNQCTW